MNEALKEKFLTVVTGVVLVVILVGGLGIMYPDYARSRALRAQNDELRKTLTSKQAEIKHLQENQRRFHTDSDFVELLARQNRRVFPGELVFSFDDRD